MSIPVIKRVTLLWILVALLASCNSARSVSEPAPYWPTEDWRTSLPELQGVNSEQLVAMFEFIEEADMDLHSILIVRNGYLITEAYFYPFQQDAKHQLLCVTKSFLSALVGIAIGENYVDPVDHQVLDFFPERTVANDDGRKATITLEHLLTMTAGWDWFHESMRFEMMRSEDWVQFVLDRPLAEEPGTQFNYNTGNTYLLSTILSSNIEISPLSFARERVFEPLGITDVVWKADARGVLSPSDLQLTSRDLAKFGYLYLRRGLWEEQQVIPADWVAASAEKYIDTVWGTGYGYHWWTWGFGAYTAQGHGGQCLFVIPELDTVVVTTGGLATSVCELPAGLLEDFVIPAAESVTPLPENPQMVARLELLIEQVEQPPEPQPMPPLPEIAHDVSERTFILEDNDFCWQSFSLDAQPETRITFSNGDESVELTVGLDDIYRITDGGQVGCPYYGIVLDGPVGAKGSWVDEMFLLDLQFLSGGDFSLRFEFDENNVDIQVRDPADRIENIHGVSQD